MQASPAATGFKKVALFVMLLSAALLALVGERTLAGLWQWFSAVKGGVRGDSVDGPGPAVILGSMVLVVVALAVRSGAAGKGATSAVRISTWAAVLAFSSLVVYLTMSLGPLTIWRL
jgi:hypothetical protein